MQRQAKILFVDGISGAGKDQHIPFIENFFKKEGYTTYTFVEPTPVFHDAIKAYRRRPKHRFSADVNLHLFVADRLDHYATNIEPLLADQNNVIITGGKFSPDQFVVPLQLNCR